MAVAMCDDGDPCTVSDLCTGGQCRGTPMDCSALEGPCGTGLCFEGACLIQPRVGAACDDANPQTSADTCRPDGSCRGTFDETLCACGDHGTCVPGESGCRCDAGYAGADCGACTTGYVAVADGCVPGCPAGMSRIGDTDVCMDHYEAQAFERPDCTGTQYTPANMYPERDYPAGFPADVESDGVAGSPQTQAVYACSLPGRLPSWRLTWYQARRACENSGKRLCTQPEWSAGCAGPTDSAYPYGDHYDPAACNGKDLYAGTGSANQTLPGGAMSGCHGSGWATDIHDTSGNLWELVEEGLRVGGSNGDLTGAKLSCSYSAEVDLWSATWWSFRCCKDL